MKKEVFEKKLQGMVEQGVFADAKNQTEIVQLFPDVEERVLGKLYAKFYSGASNSWFGPYYVHRSGYKGRQEVEYNRIVDGSHAILLGNTSGRLYRINHVADDFDLVSFAIPYHDDDEIANYPATFLYRMAELDGFKVSLDERSERWHFHVEDAAKSNTIAVALYDWPDLVQRVQSEAVRVACLTLSIEEFSALREMNIE